MSYALPSPRRNYPCRDVRHWVVNSRDSERLRKLYGKARWRKRKEIARVRLKDQSIHLAELHWYDATGIGKHEFKIKRFIEGF